MFKKLKLKYDENIVWLYPIFHMLFAALLAYIVIRVDISERGLFKYIPRIFLTSVPLARTILGSLAGSLLTITTFTFSTVMAVLTMYSSNYSPRIVQNFLKKKISLRVLGIFLGGFIYSITSLLFMRDSLYTDHVVSASIGVLYAIVSSIYFVFLSHKLLNLVKPHI
ncbi:MAG: DUF2254 domain-containing protein [Clostridiaceae bacterium]|nr:DUF2254 domain-containing protein [Clostridiaceae bacterium]